MSPQGYVSPELTHFVGRGKPAEEQFELLVKILRTGWLTHPPHRERHEAHVRIYRRSVPSENVTYQPVAVCFCDIPLKDLPLHMGKYSRFGLAFPKAFLVTQGASPVFYVSQTSMIWRRKAAFRVAEFRRVAATEPLPDSLGVVDEKIMERSPLGDAIDDVHARKWDLFYDRVKLIEGGMLPKEVMEHLVEMYSVDMNMSRLLFSMMKVFDPSTPEDAPENYYMEREWRVVDNVNFCLKDVARVIVPAEYVGRLAQAMPEYRGEVTPA